MPYVFSHMACVFFDVRCRVYFLVCVYSFNSVWNGIIAVSRVFCGMQVKMF